MTFDDFKKWFANSPIASFLRHFVAVLIAVALNDISQGGHFDFGNYEQWIIAALVAAIPPFLRWLNPYDPVEFHFSKNNAQG